MKLNIIVKQVFTNENIDKMPTLKYVEITKSGKASVKEKYATLRRKYVTYDHTNVKGTMSSFLRELLTSQKNQTPLTLDLNEKEYNGYTNIWANPINEAVSLDLLDELEA